MFATAVSVILMVTLIHGAWGKGKKKLAREPAQAIGFFAELAFLRAGSWPRDLGTAVSRLPQGGPCGRLNHPPGAPPAPARGRSWPP